jgi:hypothetical protein
VKRVPEKLFQVTNVIRTVARTRSGDFVDVYEIEFITPSGTKSSVQIPVDDFSPEVAKAVITEEAKKIEEVYRL